MSRRLLLIPLLLATCVPVLNATERREVRAPATAELEPASQNGASQRVAGSLAADYNVNRVTVEHGATSRVYSANYGVGVSVGQNAIGKVGGAGYNVGLGFWYGQAGCPVTLTGDVNQSGSISAPDIVYLVNVVFKEWPDPLPCRAAGDVNCSGSITFRHCWTGELRV